MRAALSDAADKWSQSHSQACIERGVAVDDLGHTDEAQESFTLELESAPLDVELGDQHDVLLVRTRENTHTLSLRSPVEDEDCVRCRWDRGTRILTITLNGKSSQQTTLEHTNTGSTLQPGSTTPCSPECPEQMQDGHQAEPQVLPQQGRHDQLGVQEESHRLRSEEHQEGPWVRPQQLRHTQQQYAQQQCGQEGPQQHAQEGSQQRQQQQQQHCTAIEEQPCTVFS